MEKNNARCISSNVGSYIRYLREQKGYSLNNLYHLSGVSSSYLNRIEKGTRRAPSVPVLQNIARALEVDEYELLNICKSNNTSNTKTISELLLTTDYLIDGHLNKSKELLVELIEAIVDSSWTEETKLQDAHDIILIIDEFKSELEV